jgi:hypothetical protein
VPPGTWFVWCGVVVVSCGHVVVVAVAVVVVVGILRRILISRKIK